MTEQERKYFEALVASRSRIADALNEPAAEGIKDNAVFKYSDQAHFIYELLQNADDTGATTARFELYPDKLIFAHNGLRQFSISNPDSAAERQDKNCGKLGDINSITAYYNSAKRTEASIGKFGIGFKAVLQYTDTPEIHDDKFHFCIKNQIVPVELLNDYPGRQPGETLFVFLFVNAEKAYADISNKLRSLSYPILFLSHLQLISFTIEDMRGMYAKETRISKDFDGTVAEQIHLVHNNGETFSEEDMWLFSRNDDAGRRYSIGYSLGETGALRSVQTDAYCFFKTKEHTGLNFFIHAPFLLNDSREHIVAGNEHNQNMVKLLAELAADSLTYLRDIGMEQGKRLIDDGILDIIPTSEDAFSEEDDINSLSFLPFFTAIREKMGVEVLLPTVDGYVSRENAYWADTVELAKLFSNEQLASLSGNPDAHWVFPSIGRSNSKYRQYIDKITDEKWCDESAIIVGRKRHWLSTNPADIVLHGLTAQFIERQPIEWLYSLYKWLSETESRTNRSKTVPIFLNQNGHASAAFDENDKPILFFSSDRIPGLNTVAPELLNNPDTNAFLTRIGIKKPALWDYIYNVIRPKYESGCAVGTDSYFQLFFDYYNECPPVKVNEFIDLIKEWAFLRSENDKACLGKASSLYFPSQELRDYFSVKPGTRFVDFGGYLREVGDEKRKFLESFLSDLGIRREPAVQSTALSSDEGRARLLFKCGSEIACEQYISSKITPWKIDYPNHAQWKEPYIDGCAEIIDSIIASSSVKLSTVLWGVLLKLVSGGASRLVQRLKGTFQYKEDNRYSWRQDSFDSNDIIQLKARPWLVSRDGKFLSPNKAFADSLDQAYNLEDENAAELIGFLGIQERHEIVQSDNLTDEQREDIDLGRIARELGFTHDEVKAILEREKQKNTIHPNNVQHTENTSTTAPAEENTGNDDDLALRKTFERQSPARKSVLKSIMRDCPEPPEALVDEDEADSDEYTPPAINFQKRIQRAEEKSRIEVDRIAREQELSEQLKAVSKYSYAWFRALIELLSLSRSENESGSREISISFGRVELEPGTERTLLLKQPSRYIPHWMEDLVADIPLKLQPKGQKERPVTIEVVSVKGYTLHTRLRNAEDIKGVDLSNATASISVQNPGFLLKSLQEGFAALNLPDDYDLKANLSENIKFVFGPPGTGKTTYLAREELIPLMLGAEDEKVLVLAPTNKAADVLAARIMELMGEDASYKSWLVRFSTTYDEKIERSDICKDRSFYLPNLRHCVLITTIARFPYDSIGGTPLREMNWDCVVIDEASMIPIANIIYPLYQAKPKQFIIAGDPLQIQPVARVEPDENIYKMVGLKSFTSPHTEPHDYEVRLLTTQYRSVPSVGEVFSRFAYGGVLKHARSEDSRRQMNIDDALNIAPLNIIKFPVSKYEGIYRAKKLGGSPYQVYSALFAYEFVAFLARKIDEATPGEAYSIGVISPYRAQADLIDRLLARAELPSNVSVQAGTIHGFQGDECDIIVAVFNPPPSISGSKDTFLDKLNIINVSISRARDSLFVLMPDSETENIEQLRLINKVEDLIKSSEEYREYSADEIEELMFCRTGYLEDNTFSTSHQDVNVYGLPEKRYEIRSEDTAIDVQIHENV